jgi:hypothetical protein
VFLLSVVSTHKAWLQAEMNFYHFGTISVMAGQKCQLYVNIQKAQFRSSLNFYKVYFYLSLLFGYNLAVIFSFSKVVGYVQICHSQ